MIALDSKALDLLARSVVAAERNETADTTFLERLSLREVAAQLRALNAESEVVILTRAEWRTIARGHGA